MRYLNFLFFLLASPIFAQNYHYGIDQGSKTISDTSIELSEVKNLPEEDLYFDSYLA